MHSRNTIATVSIFTALVLSAGVAAQGCGPDKPADAPTSGANTAASAMPSAMPSAAPSAATNVAPAGDPAWKARMDALKAAPVAAPVTSTGKDDMWQRALVDTATWGGTGWTPDGPYYKTALTEKGLARVDVTMKGGKCYEVIGYAKLGSIVDYDIAVLKSTGEAVAQDDDDDATPTVGKPPICPTADATYSLELKSDKGAGDVVVQLFSKAK